MSEAHEQEQVVQDTWKAQAERGVEQFQALMRGYLALRDALTAKDQQIDYLKERVEFRRYEEAETALAEARQQLAALRHAVEGYGKIIAWAIGEAGEFPAPPDDWATRKHKPWYWWRQEMRERATEVIGKVAALSASRAPQGETPK
jgi:hypothetical protein